MQTFIVLFYNPYIHTIINLLTKTSIHSLGLAERIFSREEEMEREKQGRFLSTCLTVFVKFVCVFPSAYSSVRTCRKLETEN